jgi:hypothetical protein
LKEARMPRRERAAQLLVVIEINVVGNFADHGW